MDLDRSSLTRGWFPAVQVVSHPQIVTVEVVHRNHLVCLAGKQGLDECAAATGQLVCNRVLTLVFVLVLTRGLTFPCADHCLDPLEGCLGIDTPFFASAFSCPVVGRALTRTPPIKTNATHAASLSLMEPHLSLDSSFG